MFHEFNCDACIVIKDVDKFLRRCSDTFKELKIRGMVDQAGLIDRRVEYYKCNEPPEMSIKNARNIPFFKDERFRYQDEYRLVFAYPKAFRLTTRIVDNGLFDYWEEISKGTPREYIVTIGSIKGITEVRRLPV
ncbi:MAG: hypothetical protein M1358_06305 [Chloroflexi bacterium]|nr:hypothetical protein [Chloroflexota bacterium]